MVLCGFCLERFPLPLGAWDGLRYFIVALPEPSYNYFSNQIFVDTHVNKVVFFQFAECFISV